MLNEFHRRYPGIKVNLLIEDRYNDLSDGRAEIALRAGPPSNGSLIGPKLSDQSWAVYGSRGYLERVGSPTMPDDLSRARSKTSRQHAGCVAWLLTVKSPAVAIAFSDCSWLSNPALGSPCCPARLGLQNQTLSASLIRSRDLRAASGSLRRPDLHKRPKIRAFFDFMSEEIVKYRPLLLGQTRPLRSDGKRLETAKTTRPAEPH